MGRNGGPGRSLRGSLEVRSLPCAFITVRLEPGSRPRRRATAQVTLTVRRPVLAIMVDVAASARSDDPSSLQLERF